MDNDTTQEIKRYFDDAVTGFRAELGVAVSGLRGEMASAVGGLRADLNVAVADLRADIEGVRQHSDVVAEGLRLELRAEIRDVKRHTDIVAESLRGDIRLVAEGVAGLDEKFIQEFVNVRAEIREQIGDVKALLRGSYVDLDRRVSALEQKPS